MYLADSHPFVTRLAAQPTNTITITVDVYGYGCASATAVAAIVIIDTAALTVPMIGVIFSLIDVTKLSAKVR